MKIIFPDKIWLDTLKVGDFVLMRYTTELGGEIYNEARRIKRITKTGIIAIEGTGYTFKDGYRRGFQYRGNCWLQPIENAPGR